MSSAQGWPRAIVKVPATTANLGAGFDALGMALDMWNIIDVQERNEPGFSVVITGDDSSTLPTDESHLVLQSMFRFYDAIDQPRPQGLTLRQHIGVPLSGGLGNSATAIIGGLLAAMKLSGVHWTSQQILNLAAHIEGHADNVAPALLGGLVAVVETDHDGVCAVSVPLHEAYRFAVVLAVPQFQLETERARSILPQKVTLHDAKYNVGRAALFVAAAVAGKMEYIGESMNDRLHQRQRGQMIPGLDHVLQEAKRAGAYGAALSGAGPTVIALVKPEKKEQVGGAMQNAFHKAGIKAHIIHTQPCLTGALVQQCVNNE